MNEVIFVITSGYINAKTGASNLGDVAQGKRSLLLMRALFPSYDLSSLANSLTDKSILSGVDVRHDLPTYLGSSPSNIAEKFIFLVKLLLIVFDAVLLRLCLPALFTSRAVRIFLSEYSRASFLFIAGSGTINQKYLKRTGGLWLFTAFLARILGVPVVAVGQQVGPFNKTLVNKWLLRLAFGKALYFGCRDHESVALLQEVGIRKSIVNFSGDEGAYLPSDETDRADEIIKALDCENGFLAVHFRLDGNCLFEHHVRCYADKVNGLANALGKPVLFIPMAYHGEGDERSAINKIRRLLTVPSAIIDCEDPALLKACLQQAVGAIGVANHFVVFCASIGVPTMAIYSTSYMKQKLLGAEQAYPYIKAIDINDLGSADLPELMCAARSHVTITDKTAYQRLPADYWLWANRLEAVGIDINSQVTNP